MGSVTSFGRSQNDAQEHAKALARVMILDGRYFPQELYSDKERKSEPSLIVIFSQEDLVQTDLSECNTQIPGMLHNGTKRHAKGVLAL